MTFGTHIEHTPTCTTPRRAPPPDVRGGARARPTLLAALIRAQAQKDKERLFSLKHAQKLTKFGTKIRPGEKFDILLLSFIATPKWLHSAPYKSEKNQLNQWFVRRT